MVTGPALIDLILKTSTNINSALILLTCLIKTPLQTQRHTADGNSTIHRFLQIILGSKGPYAKQLLEEMPAKKQKKSAVCCSISSGSPNCNTIHNISQGETQGAEDGACLYCCVVCLPALFQCVYTVCLYPYCSGVELHFEFFQVEPVFGLAGVQVMVEVTCRIAKTVEFPVGSQQDRGWSLLIGHTRVPTFPTPGRRQVSHQYMHHKSVLVVLY